MEGRKFSQTGKSLARSGKEGLSIGDATIKDVATYYREAGYGVEILTGDEGLKAYEPTLITAPRRRRSNT